MTRTLRRAGVTLLLGATLLAATAAQAQQPTPKKLDLALEVGASAGRGSATHDGAHGWIDGSPTFNGSSLSLRANRVTLGVVFANAQTDTTYYPDPANGGRLLIVLRPVTRISESIHTRAVLFTARVQLFTTPRTLNPYFSAALGSAKLRDRVVGDTAGTQISSVVGRRAMSLGAGLETRGYAVPYLGGLLAHAFVEGQYWTRNASGASVRQGVFYTSPYGPTNNYYQARDHYLYGLDTPPGKWTYVAVSLGFRLQYTL